MQLISALFLFVFAGVFVCVCTVVSCVLNYRISFINVWKCKEVSVVAIRHVIRTSTNEAAGYDKTSCQTALYNYCSVFFI